MKGFAATAAAAATVAALLPAAAGAAVPWPTLMGKCFNESGGYLRDDLMVGSPCAPFRDRARVAAYVRQLLVYNGFRPNVTVDRLWARQLRLGGIRDGIPYGIVVVKSGPRELALKLIAGGVPHYDQTAVPFDA